MISGEPLPCFAHDMPTWPGLDFRIGAADRGRGIDTAAPVKWHDE